MVVEFNRIFAIESKRYFFCDLSLKGRDDRLFDLRGRDPRDRSELGGSRFAMQTWLRDIVAVANAGLGGG